MIMPIIKLFILAWKKYWGENLKIKWKSKRESFYWRYLYWIIKRCVKNDLFYIEGYIEDLSLKLKGPFHVRSYLSKESILDFNYTYCCLNHKNKQLACLMITKIENNANYENNE